MLATLTHWFLASLTLTAGALCGAGALVTMATLVASRSGNLRAWLPAAALAALGTWLVVRGRRALRRARNRTALRLEARRTRGGRDLRATWRP